MKQEEAYLRAVRRGLEDAPPEDRERLMRRLTEAVSAYLEETPEAGEADIIKAFGTAEDCAAELLEECDPVRIAAVRRKRRWKTYAVIGVLILMTVLLALAAVRGLGGRPAVPDDSALPAVVDVYTEKHHGYGHH